MTVAIAKEAARLAAIIGEQPPLLGSEAELRDYVKSVWQRNELRYWDAQNTIDEVLMHVDPVSFRESSIEKQGKLDRERKRDRALWEKRQQGAASKRQQGVNTRARVLAAQRPLADRPTHEHASLIAKRLNVSPRTVRRHLRTRKPADPLDK